MGNNGACVNCGSQGGEVIPCSGVIPPWCGEEFESYSCEAVQVAVEGIARGNPDTTADRLPNTLCYPCADESGGQCAVCELAYLEEVEERVWALGDEDSHNGDNW